MPGTSPDLPTPDGTTSSVTALLDRTTPPSVPPLDLDDLARRGRARRRRQRAGLVGGVAALVALLLVATVGLTRGDDADDVDVAQPGPNGAPLTEPVGSWSQVADPPFGPRSGSFAGTLSDGRVLVWGGDSDAEEGVAEGGVAELDGGIYDPASGSWTAIPAAPIGDPIASGGASATAAALAGDRLAVVMGSNDGNRILAAVYDVGEQRWHEAPVQDAIKVTYDGLAWDGETLAVVRLQPGEIGFADAPGLDWRVDAPVTLRWSPGEPEWQTGAPAPLSLRSHAGVSFDGTRLAVWGGTTTPPHTFADGPDPGVQADGALYDLATDTWQPLPAAPLPARTHPGVVWSDGRLLVGGGSDRTTDAETLTDAAAYDPATGTWAPIDGPPDGGLDSTSRVSYVAGTPPFVVAGWMSYGVTEPGQEPPQWFLGPDGWEQAPDLNLHRVGDFLVSTTAVGGNPGDGPFGLQIRTGRDVWLDSAGGPFGNRMDPTIVATGDQLLVIGGYQGRGLELMGDAWIFDLGG
jgi:hypothetical protein